MALTIGQIAAMSYPSILANVQLVAQQWAESAFRAHLEDPLRRAVREARAHASSGTDVARDHHTLTHQEE